MFDMNLLQCTSISQTPFDHRAKHSPVHHRSIPIHSRLSTPDSTTINFLFSITMSPTAKNKERASTGKGRKTSAGRSTRQSKRVAVDTRKVVNRSTRSRPQQGTRTSRASQQQAGCEMETDMQRRSSERQPQHSDEDNAIAEADTPPRKKAKFVTFQGSNPVSERGTSPPPRSRAEGSRSRLTFNPDATRALRESASGRRASSGQPRSSRSTRPPNNNDNQVVSAIPTPEPSDSLGVSPTPVSVRPPPSPIRSTLRSGAPPNRDIVPTPVSVRLPPSSVRTTPRSVAPLNRDISRVGSFVGDSNEVDSRVERRERLDLEERREEGGNRSEVSGLKQLVNKYKTKLKKSEENNVQFTLMNKLMIEQLDIAKTEIRTLKAENESLRAFTINTEGRGTTPVQKKQSRGKRYEIGVDVTFLGIATTIERKLLHWCHRETKELQHTGEELKRLWRRRGIRCERNGIAGERSNLHIPFPPMVIAERREYYTPSYSSERSFLLEMVRDEYNSGKWESLFQEEGQLRACEEAISADRGLGMRLKQTLSDCIGGRKRNAKDKLFQCLGYSYLVSRHPKPKNDLEHAEMRKQKNEAVEKLLSDRENGIPTDLSRWRTRKVSELLYSGERARNAMGEENENVLFRNDVSISVLQEFQGYNIPIDGKEFMESSITRLARLDAWIATVVCSLEGSIGQGGQRQKIFQDMFGKFLPAATMQILSSVIELIRRKHPLEVGMAQSGRQPDDEVMREEDRVATAVIDDTQQQMQYLVVTERWFSENVGKELGCVMDCFIGKKDYASDNFKLVNEREVLRAENVDVDVEEVDNFISLSYNDPVLNDDQGDNGLLSSEGTDIVDNRQDAVQ